MASEGQRRPETAAAAEDRGLENRKWWRLGTRCGG